jgi:hypothetical protein
MSYKRGVIDLLLKQLDKDCEYNPLFKTSMKQLDKSHLFPADLSDQFEDDGILGRFGKMYYRISDMGLRKNFRAVFTGVLITLKTGLEVSRNTLLLEHGRHPRRKGFIHSGHTGRFDIYSEAGGSDPDPYLEKLSLLLNCFWFPGICDMKVSFTGDDIFIALRVPRNLFEMSFRPLRKQKGQIREDLELLKDIFGLMRDCENTLYPVTVPS